LLGVRDTGQQEVNVWTGFGVEKCLGENVGRIDGSGLPQDSDFARVDVVADLEESGIDVTIVVRDLVSEFGSLNCRGIIDIHGSGDIWEHEGKFDEGEAEA